MNLTLRGASAATALMALVMGPFFAWQLWSQDVAWAKAIAIGFAAGLACGLVFAGLMWAFLRSPWVRAQIELHPHELLPGERLLHSALGNLVVDPARFGLRPFAFGDLGFLLGMRGKEVIGGALHLTNLRLVFKSHRLNRLRGVISLFLPSMQAVECTRVVVLRRLRVRTENAQIEFTLLDAAEMQAQVARAREDFGVEERAALAALQSRLEGLDALQPDAVIDRINAVLHFGRAGQDVVEAATAPLLALGGLLAGEVFDRSLAERWSRWMQR